MFKLHNEENDIQRQVWLQKGDNVLGVSEIYLKGISNNLIKMNSLLEQEQCQD